MAAGDKGGGAADQAIGGGDIRTGVPDEALPNVRRQEAGAADRPGTCRRQTI